MRSLAADAVNFFAEGTVVAPCGDSGALVGVDAGRADLCVAGANHSFLVGNSSKSTAVTDNSVR